MAKRCYNVAVGKSIKDFQGALKNPQKITISNQINTFHHALQLLIVLSGSFNKTFALPNPNLDIYRVRVTEAMNFLDIYAPNSKFKVR